HSGRNGLPLKRIRRPTPAAAIAALTSDTVLASVLPALPVVVGVREAKRRPKLWGRAGIDSTGRSRTRPKALTPASNCVRRDAGRAVFCLSQLRTSCSVAMARAFSGPAWPAGWELLAVGLLKSIKAYYIEKHGMICW